MDTTPAGETVPAKYDEAASDRLMSLRGNKPVLLACCLLAGACSSQKNLPDGITIEAGVVIRQNFSFSFLKSLRLNETSPDAAESLLHRPPKIPPDNFVPPAPRKHDVPLTEEVASYNYVETGACTTRKAVVLTFDNGRLQSYNAYSGLPGETRPPISAREIADIRPGKATRADVLSALGQPDYWWTGLALVRTNGPEEIGYYWISSRSPDLRITGLVIKLDEKGTVLGAPALTAWPNLPLLGWYCGWPPPIP